MRYVIFLLLAIAALSQPSRQWDGAAAAEASACGKRSELLAHLAGRFAEEPVARGQTRDGAVVEILASIDGASFTVIRTTPDGISCLIATGSDWNSVKQRLEDSGA